MPSLPGLSSTPSVTVPLPSTRNSPESAFGSVAYDLSTVLSAALPGVSCHGRLPRAATDDSPVETRELKLSAVAFTCASLAAISASVP